MVGLDKTEYKAAPHLIKEIKTRASKDSCQPIHALTIFDEALFNNKSRFLDAYSLSLLRCTYLIEDIRNSMGYCVPCTINKCLYIMNWANDQSKTIIRMHAKGNVIKQWSTGSNCGRLSITEDSNIIMAAYKSDKLIEYTADGGLEREIKLSYQMAHPQHAIKLDNSNIIIIHGMYDDYEQRVALLDTNGNLLASFGGRKGTKQRTFSWSNLFSCGQRGNDFCS